MEYGTSFWLWQVYFGSEGWGLRAGGVLHCGGVYYTVIKHDRHLRTRGNCGKHEPQVSVFYISRVFSND